MGNIKKKALLINPPIYDVQFWGEWSQPHGLLKIGSYLRKQGYELRLLDSLYSPPGQQVRKKIISVAEIGSKPAEIPYQEFRRTHNRLGKNQRYKYHFGLTLDQIKQELTQMAGILHTGTNGHKQGYISNLFVEDSYLPDEIWITSIMTYWWESTVDIAVLCNEIFPSARIRIGGIYPTLASYHLKEKLDLRGLNFIIKHGYQFTLDDPNDVIVIGEILPASWEDLDFELYFEHNLSSSRYYHGPGHDDPNIAEAISQRKHYGPRYSILTTTRGCPFDCAYCAQRAYNLYDNPYAKANIWTNEEGKRISVRTKGSKETLDEILDKFHTYGISKFAFYEDNFLMEQDHFKEVLEGIISNPDLNGNLHLHAPEGIEIRLIDDELAKLMHLAGFERVYLPLENINSDVVKSWNRSHSNVQMFERAVENCIEAGFRLRNMEINAFILFGTPGESIKDVVDSVLYASSRIGSVIPMLFTPVPGSRMFDEYSNYIFDEMGFDLHHLNGKLLPFLEYNKRIEPQITAEDYLNLESLMFRLNAQAVRGTFDIGGTSRVAEVFRSTVISHS